ncbi:MAG: SoxR reducing system RseC family protein [Brevinematales bacterium]|nr:SoxR reducing system RseC family protein [Brevinematales bacterium]
MEKRGVIIGIENHKTLVQLGSGEANNCGGCKLHGICKPDKTGAIIEIPGRTHYSVGTPVTLTMNETRSIIGAFFLFIFPIIAAILGFILFRALGFTEGICILGSIGSLIASVALFLVFERLFLSHMRINPVEDSEKPF